MRLWPFRVITEGFQGEAASSVDLYGGIFVREHAVTAIPPTASVP